jgi:hypothetical protein
MLNENTLKQTLGLSAARLSAQAGAGGVPTENSQLLLGMDGEGRPVMSTYEVCTFFCYIYILHSV